MKLIRFLDLDGEARFGHRSSEGDFLLEGDFPNFQKTDRPAQVKKLLAPIRPTQIVGIGQNYRRHAAESNSPPPEFPIIFFKNLGSLQNPDDPIVLPKLLKTAKPDYEGELAVVIGKECRNVPEETALDVVFGYTIANDVSARDWQRDWGGSQWCRAKSFDTFCPMGPVIVTTDELPNPNSLRLKTTLNEEVVQDWGTDDMIFSVKKLIAFLTSDTTVPAGTVILTGTPHGVGMGRKPPLWLKTGDRVTIEIEPIGQLTNYVE